MSSEKKRKLPFIIIAIVALVATIAGGWYLYQMLTHSQEEPDSSIFKVESQDSEDPKNDVDVSLQYAGSATLFSDKKLITFNFTNPSKSKKSLDLEIIANINGEDIVLAKTDRVYPGYKIDSTKYKLDQEIPKGNYKGKFIAHFYNEQNKEEIVNSEIAIDIYVK